MNKVHCILLIISLFCFKKMLGQSSLVRTVPLIEQKAYNWCWAASLEMVVKYHEPLTTINQCQLASYNINKIASPYMKSCCSCSNCTDSNKKNCQNCSECSSCTCCHVLESFTHNSCNQIMESLNKYRTKVFNKINYNAEVFQGILPIAAIENEINICQRPLIIIYNNFSHASTVIGSYRTASDYFIKVNNPKDGPCHAAVNDINYSTSHPESSYGFVYKIYPKSVGNTCPSTMTRSISPIAFMKKNKINDSINTSRIENGIYERLSDEDLKKIINSKSHYRIPVRYLSSKTLSKIPSNKLKVMNTIIKKEYIELVSEKTPYTVTIFQKEKNEWIPIRISLLDSKLRAKFTLNDSIQIVDNTDKSFKKLCNNGSFEHIKYFDLDYDFYRFCEKGQYFMIPLYNYDISKNIKLINSDKSYATTGKIFVQKDILKFFKKQTAYNKLK